MEYADYITSELWQITAAEAKARAHHQCMLCPETRALEVHHRSYARLGHERPEDLVVLCWWCHRRHHGTIASNRRNVAEQGWLPFVASIPDGSDLN
jgi:5-methylcytosine-specific restriction endonuclease McrA